MIVYLVTNRINGKVYVGKYIGDDPLVRWSAHVRRAQHGANQHLSNAIRKHGANAFIVSVLERCTSEEELNVRESFHIERLRSNKTGYNMTTGGEGFSKGNQYRAGMKLSDEHKASISRANRGPKSPETIERMREAQRNRAPLSPVARQHMSEAQKHRVHLPHTEETKRKMSLGKKGKPLNDKQLASARANGIARRGVPWSDVRRANPGRSLKGIPRPLYVVEKVRVALKGKPFTQLHREAIRRGKTGVKLSVLHRAHISERVSKARLQMHMDYLHFVWRMPLVTV